MLGQNLDSNWPEEYLSMRNNIPAVKGKVLEA